jgi:hypothetical protein
MQQPFSEASSTPPSGPSHADAATSSAVAASDTLSHVHAGPAPVSPDDPLPFVSLLSATRKALFEAPHTDSAAQLGVASDAVSAGKENTFDRGHS